ncbi:hypothetical protein PMAYCL1PPCAC_24726, partial [Pristionchus mayeri]
MVKKTTDYPTSSPFEGELESTERISDLPDEPLTSHVSVYHPGRSDEEPTPSTKLDIGEKAKEIGDKIGGFFKSKDKHAEYPISEPYEGPLDDTLRASELQDEPLTSHVAVYHSGRSDEPTVAQPKEVEVAPAVEKVKTTTDYPTSSPFEGELESTERISDRPDEPLTSHVSVYHPCRSDEEPTPSTVAPHEEKPEKKKLDIGEKAKEIGDKIGGFFKSKDKHAEYPISEPYEGPLDDTLRASELQDEPLTSHVAVYHSGRSDEPTVAQPKEVEVAPAVEKVKTTTDYPTSSPFEGELESTERISDLPDEPLTSHVSVYHPCRSDEEPTPSTVAPHEEKPEKKKLDIGEKAKEIGDKIGGLFKSKDKHAEYPISEPYQGPLDDTLRASELQDEPLTSHVAVYHSGRSDEPTVAQPKEVEVAPAVEKVKKTTDYPTSSPFEGELESTERISDLPDEPLTSHVSVYHPGRSDEELTPSTFAPHEEKPEKKKLDIGEKAKEIGDKIGGLFKSKDKHAEYPISEPYEGPLDDTLRASELQDEPLTSHVAVYHSGRSDEPTVAQPKEVEVAPAVEKVKTTTDYPTSSPFEGELESTERISDLPDEPLTSHVSVYHPGRSDEEPTPSTVAPHEEKPEKKKLDIGEKAKEIGDKIGGLFKSKDKHAEYPISEPYQGPLDDTLRASELQDEPLTSHVAVYHSGRSDEPTVAQPKEVEVAPAVEKVKKTTDYPTSSPFEGELESTERISDLPDEPLTSHVSVYHPGRSDEELTPSTFAPHEEKPEKKKLDIGEKAKEIGDKIGGLFKSKDKHAEYPISEPYQGPLDDTLRASELQDEPLTSHVAVYHSGRSDEPTVAQPKEVEVAPAVEKVKKTTDYPTSSPFEGELESTERISDLPDEPLTSHVSVYHPGRSDEELTPSTFAPHEEKPEKPEKKKLDIGEKAKEIGDKIGGLFKSKDKHAEYPISEPYQGPLDDTLRASELQDEPLTSHVAVYHSGRSDEPTVAQPKEVEVAPAVEKVKKTTDYPTSSPFEGELESTERISDLPDEPLTSHVSVYHPGRSDEELTPSTVAPHEEKPEKKKLDIGEKAKEIGDKIGGLFKSKDKHAEYPISEPYQGPLDDTLRASELQDEPLTSHVAVYHSGRSDEPTVAQPKEVEVAPAVEKVKKTTDYPTSSPFEGELESTERISDLPDEPLTSHVSVYHPGRSDEELTPSTVAPHEEKPEKKKLDIGEKAKEIGDKIGGLFKSKDKHAEYPISEPYQGPLDDTLRASELQDEPLTSHVAVYHSGRSDEPTVAQPKEVEVAPAVEKVKKTTDYPTSSPFEGELESTERISDLPDEPLTSHVSVYHPGRSDEELTPSTVAPHEEKPEKKKLDIGEKAKEIGDKIGGLFKSKDKHAEYPISEPYEGPLDDTLRASELQDEPLTSHVAVYHSGRSDEPTVAQPKEVEVAPAVEKVKKTTDYPTSSPFEGELESAERISDLPDEPLTSHVSVYHPGRSDEELTPSTVAPHEEKPEKKKLDIGEKAKEIGDKIGGLFKSKDKHAEYPISEPYQGPLDDTLRASELQDEPLTSHVAVYHSGRSDEPTVAQPKEVEVAPAVEKVKKTTDYPTSSPFEGELESTERISDLPDEPLTSHVSVYHPGRSDEELTPSTVAPHEEKPEKKKLDIGEKAKEIGDKIGGLFKSKDKHAEYPISEPYEGPLDDTLRASELQDEPLTSHVAVYHSGRSDEPTVAQPKEVEVAPAVEKVKKTTDYPTSSPFEGELESAERISDLPDEPLTSHVSVYHPGRSDEELTPSTVAPHEEKPEKKKLDIGEKAKEIGDKIGGLFKSKDKHAEYPISEPYQGPLDDTLRASELQDEPLTSHVAVYHSGRSDEPTVAQPKEVEVAPAVEKVKKTTDYPTSSPFEGELESTERISDLPDEPLTSHVSVYHPGRSDEELTPSTVAPHEEKPEKKKLDIGEKAKEIGDKIGGLFKSKDKHAEYPISEPYEGPLDDTLRASELQDEPLTSHVAVYHSGRSDEPTVAQPKEVEVAPAVEKVKKTTDYPTSSPFEGELESAERISDLPDEPLTSHVSVYHPGRSDEELTPSTVAPHEEKPEKKKLDIGEKAKEIGDKIGGLFKSKDKHAEYPISEPYQGPLDDTLRASELQDEPLTSHVAVYHSGRSDEPTVAQPKEVEVAPAVEKVKKTTDYPTSSPFEGELESTERISDLPDEPLTSHVSVYHPGRSDEELTPSTVAPHEEKPEKKKLDIGEKAKEIGDKIGGLFKSKDKHAEYPISEPYQGPLDDTLRASELQDEPLTSHVAVYHSGRSDEPTVAQPKEVEVAPAVEKVKKTTDYPTSSPFEGELESTERISDLPDEPLTSHVSVYHPGRSDEELTPSTVAPHEEKPEKKKLDIGEKAKEIGDKIGGLFKSKDKHAEYPISEPYEGPLDDTLRASELQDEPLTSHVAVYHSGRSDEPTVAQPKEVEVAPAVEKVKKTTDYPTSSPFEGELESTERISDLPDEPLTSHVSVYHPGRSDEELTPSTVAPHEEKPEKKKLDIGEKAKEIGDKIGGLFKSKDKHAEYPISEPYQGPLDDTLRASELQDEPLTSHVAVYHSGRSDEPTVAQPKEVEVAPAVEKVKKTTDYPTSSPFEGELESTERISDLPDEPLTSHVSVYHPGRSDEELTPSTVAPHEEKPEKKKLDIGEKAKEIGDKIGGLFKSKDKHAEYPISEPYEGPLDDTLRASELQDEPLTSHVAVYHSGRSDEPTVAQPKEVEVAPAVEKVKKTTDYPTSSPFEGELESAERISDLPDEPLTSHVSVYHPGRSDEELTPSTVAPHEEKPEKKKLDIGEKAKEIGDKIGGLFKSKDKHAEYPISEPYEGPLDDTLRASELQDEPLTSHVAVYHSGRSDEPTVAQPKEVEVAPAVEKVKKTTDYPTSSPFEGELESAERISDLPDEPLTSHVSVYHPGRSDEELTPSTVAPHEEKPEKKKLDIGEKAKEIGDKIGGLFKSKDKHAEYPISEPYQGPLDDTLRASELQDEPLTSHVAVYHSGRSDEPTVAQPKEVEVAPAVEKVKKTTDYPTSSPFEGELESAERISDLPDEPLTSHVSVYHPGRSDEELTPSTVAPHEEKPEKKKLDIGEKAKEIGDKIGGLFKSKDKHAEYPISEPYEGPLDDTLRASELQDEPLTSHVAVYHSGRSDEPTVAQPKEVEVAPAVEKVKKTTDYPTSSPFEGELESAERISDLPDEPLTSHVSVYHPGRSDEELTPSTVAPHEEKPEKKKLDIGEKAKEIGDKIGGLFKSKDKHAEYPISEPYQGALDDTLRASELQDEPLTSHVAVYHSGRSDEPTVAQPKEVEVAPAVEKVKKTTDYPTSSPFEGELESTERISDLPDEPLTSHVSVYHPGRSDEELTPSTVAPHEEKPEKPEKKKLDIGEKAKEIGDKIGGLFKSKDKHAEYPISEPYQGPLDDTLRASELQDEPLTSHVAVYHSGRSDEPTVAQPKEVEVAPAVEKVKKTTDYPTSSPFEGELESAERISDLPDEPLTSHVSVYHPGRSDEELTPSTVAPHEEKPEKKKLDIGEKAKEIGDKIGGLFKSKDKHAEYPISEPYQGPLDDTLRASELQDEPLTSHVAVYHSGRSDEPTVAQPKEVEVAPAVEKVKKTTDYPTSSPFEGELESTERISDLPDEPLTSHVSVYHPGRSDEELTPSTVAPHEEKPEKKKLDIGEKAKEIGDKIGGLFKSKDKHAEYPISEPYEGPLDDTLRASELQDEPLTSHVAVYHSGRSDEPTVAQPKEVEVAPAVEKVKKTTDYPTSSPFEGELESAERISDLPDEPLTSHVSVYHPGRSDEELTPSTVAPHEEKPEKKKLDIGEKAKEIGDKIGGLFKSKDKHAEYPISEPYQGPLDDTLRASELQDEPLTSHVAVYHSGRSDEPTVAQPKEVEVAPAVEKVKKTTDYPTSSPFEGELESTERISDLPDEPLTSHVSVYHPGRSDEELTPSTVAPHEEKPEKKKLDIGEKAKEIGDKIGGLFKSKDKHAEYPISEPYQGPLDDTLRASELQDEPLTSHVAVYHSGRSDEPTVAQPKEVEVAPAVEKVKKTTDYPTSSPFEGELESTERISDLPDEPLTSHVSVYHPGRSDEELTPSTVAPHEEKPEKKKLDIGEKAKEIGDKIGGLFKSKDKHAEYPISEPYEGPLDDTLRASELQDEPLTSHVAVYHSGRSDEPTVAQPKEVEVAPAVEKVKKTTDYPTSSPFEGELESAERISDLPDEPLTSHVSVYHPGRSDEELTPSTVAPHEEKPEKKKLDIGEKAKEIGDKIGGLFKSKDKHAEYPISEPYQGPLDDTLRASELQDEPLTSHVAVYHSGRSDEPTVAQPKEVEVAPAVEKVKTTTEYPTSSPFEGELESTERISDLPDEPLTSHVSVYHPGRSDEEPTPSTVAPHEEKPEKKKLDIGEKAKEIGDKIGGLFNSKDKHAEYPISEPYEGPLDDTLRASELQDEPLTSHVAVYHSGRSDEPTVAQPKEVEVAPAVEKVKKTTDYPTSSPFEGDLESTERISDLPDEPLTSHVSVYHPGRSDEEPTPSTVAPHEEKPEKKKLDIGEKAKEIGDKIGGLFKSKDKHAEYPISEPYEGPLDDTLRASELQDEPLTSHVAVYHSGRSDEPTVAQPKEVEVAPAVEKVKTTTEYPTSSPFEGELESTERISDLPDEPLTSHVSVYHPGRSDEEPTPSTVAPHEEKPEKKKLDIGEKAKEIGDKIGGLFNSKDKHAEYPISEPYEGPLDDTLRASELQDEPLTSHVAVYHSGRSDEPTVAQPKEVEVAPAVEKVKTTTDYPTSSPFEGELESTERISDLPDEPLTSHVSVEYDQADDFVIDSSSVDFPHSEPVDSTRVLDEGQTQPIFADSISQLRHPRGDEEFIIDSHPADHSPEKPIGSLESMHPSIRHDKPEYGDMYDDAPA